MAAKKRKSTKKKKDGGFGVFITGAAAAASAGAYYLYGPEGRQHRKKVRGWMLKASGEVMEKAEKLKEIDEGRFDTLLEQMEKKYKKVRAIDNKDIAKLRRDLKAQWKHVEMEAGKGKAAGKKAVATGKRTAKKAKTKARRKVHKTATKVAKRTAPKKKAAKRKTTKK